MSQNAFCTLQPALLNDFRVFRGSIALDTQHELKKKASIR